MEASCTSYAYGTMAGNATGQADAEQAYVQAMFLGTPTFLRLPKHQWPDAWQQKGYVDPVVPMGLALYGHPDSGAYWEQKAEKGPNFRRFPAYRELEELLRAPRT